MQSEIHCNETVASGCQTEHNHDSKVYQQLIHCHHLNRRNSDCCQPCNDGNNCNQNRNIYPIYDVTDTSDCVNRCCARADALVSLDTSQAKCPKQEAKCIKIAASVTDDNDASGYSKPSSCQANCRDQHDKDYHKLFASDFRYMNVAMTNSVQ